MRIFVDASAGAPAIDAVRLLTGGSALETTLSSRSLTGGGYYVEASYDDDDRVSEETTYYFDVIVSIVEYEYDETEGWLSAINETDELDRTTRTEFNDKGLTTAKELAYGTANAARTEFEYNEDGNMTSLTDSLNNTTSWGYDSLGREITMTDPLNKTVTKTYDNEGRLASILSRNNLLRTFAYDEEGRVDTETWYAGATTQDPVEQTYTWDYDEEGRLESAGNDVGDYTFKYDHTGLLTEVENPFGVTLYFKYDDRGFRTLVEDSFGGSVASDYNDAGQLKSRIYTATNEPDLRIDLEYDDLGRVLNQTRYSDAAGTTVVATSDFSYDESGRLDSLEHRNASEQLIADYVWDWDAVGQLISQTDHGVTREYDYDEQGQLISEDIDQNLTEWDYDTNGNRNTTGYSVGTGNRILSDGVWDYTYDDEGNLTEKDEINGDLRWTYGYDHANQLVEVKSYDGQSLLDEILFRYDVFGNRVEKEVNPAPVGPSELIERYVYDGWNPLKPTPIGNENWDVVIDINDMGSLTRRYLRGDVVDELFARVEGGTDALWLLGDHLGSIRDVIDDSGNPVKSVEYDAWGNIISQSGTGELGRYTYTSREWDVETQLQYNRARYYDPALGRWITQDPIGFAAGDSNLYRYVNNRPTIATDPSGMQGARLGRPLPLFLDDLRVFAEKTGQERDFRKYLAWGESPYSMYLKLTGNYEGFVKNNEIVKQPKWINIPGDGKFKKQLLPSLGNPIYPARDFARLLELSKVKEPGKFKIVDAPPPAPAMQGLFVLPEKSDKNWAKAREQIINILKSAETSKNKLYIGPLNILYVKDSKLFLTNIKKTALENLAERIAEYEKEHSQKLNEAPTPQDFLKMLGKAGLRGGIKELAVDGDRVKALLRENTPRLFKALEDLGVINEQAKTAENEPNLSKPARVWEFRADKGIVTDVRWLTMPSFNFDYDNYKEGKDFFSFKWGIKVNFKQGETEVGNLEPYIQVAPDDKGKSVYGVGATFLWRW